MANGSSFFSSAKYAAFVALLALAAAIACVVSQAAPLFPQGRDMAFASDGKALMTESTIQFANDQGTITSITKATYNEASITWIPDPTASGYFIERAQIDKFGHVIGDFEQVKRVDGADASNTTFPAPWNTEYAYRITPFVSSDDPYVSRYYDGNYVTYALPAASVKLVSVAKSGSRYLKVSWTADEGASDFEVLRSTFESSGYKCIAKTSDKSYVDKSVKPGVTYYYRIRARYPGYEAVTSNSIAQFLKKKTSVMRKTAKTAQQGYFDETYYYTQGSMLYAVVYRNSTLKVYGLNSSLKIVSTKTVKLPKHELWGGFYHGPDGCNYVTIGYKNLKESESKTVIKVIKYSSAWKQGKTASIKAATKGASDKIYRPFDAGTVSFDMKESTLCLFTCGQAFASKLDGKHHQSSTAFLIDTKTMKVSSGLMGFVSHSFDQRVKFKDDSIYFADHGDAYGRGICLTMRKDYGIDWESELSVIPFKFMGKKGENYTGATMGDMEIGATNVLVCGAAQPHYFKVCGVKGFAEYKFNAFLTVTNRATGKSSVKWLTSINPKKGKQEVNSKPRMVKLSDDRFAVLYSIENYKNYKKTFCCAIVNNAGKKVTSKTYKNIIFSGTSQPVVFDGAICWMERIPGDKSTIYKIPIP